MYFDHSDPDTIQDPFPVFQKLRDECPVGRGERFGGFWVYSRYEDVLAASLDTGTYSSASGVTIPVLGVGVPLIPIAVDPPEHKGLRVVLQPLLTKQAVVRYEDRIRRTARELISAFADDGSADLSKMLAVPLPPLVIADLFGLPAADCDYFCALTQAMIGAGEAEAGAVAGRELLDYLRGQLDSRIADPQDDLATLIAHAVLPDGSPLSDDEKLGMAQVTVVAGHETTVASIAAMLRSLGTVPGLQQRLIEDPTLIPAAVEETLRMDAPVQSFARTLVSDVDRHGVGMKSGEKVLLLYGSANRDERRFEDPTQFRLDRRSNPHLSFGAGIHRCVGAPLALLEMRIVMEEILLAIPGYTVEAEQTTVRGIITRVFDSVPARWVQR